MSLKKVAFLLDKMREIIDYLSELEFVVKFAQEVECYDDDGLDISQRPQMCMVFFCTCMKLLSFSFFQVCFNVRYRDSNYSV